jgi:hypothetical protein
MQFNLSRIHHQRQPFGMPRNLPSPMPLQREFVAEHANIPVPDIPLSEYVARVVDIDYIDVRLIPSKLEKFLNCPFFNSNNPYFLKVI